MNPYQQRSSASRRTPPPDGVRHAPTQRTPPSDMVTANIPASRSTGEVPAPSQFLIVGLFALRLTKRLIQGLEPYTDRDTDIDWLDNFLGYFALDFALARISGVMRTDYLQTYPLIISRMKKQPRYPIHFMRLNPDKSARNAGQPRAGDSESTEWTDIDKLNMIDFCDAASEWGSIVPLPAQEASRMVELADQRRIASDEGSDAREQSHRTGRFDPYPDPDRMVTR